MFKAEADFLVLDANDLLLASDCGAEETADFFDDDFGVLPIIFIIREKREEKRRLKSLFNHPFFSDIF